MKRPVAIIIPVLLMCCRILSGQAIKEDETAAGELALTIKSMNFIKDNEYVNPVVAGNTLLGFFFQPELVYSPSGKVTLRAGTHLLKYYGTTKFSQVRPVFSASLKISENASLTLGTLSGSDSHRLFDPHFSRERLYYAYAEDGFQLKMENEHLFTDTWLSWENFIFKGDSVREVFTSGESFRYKSSMIGGFMQIEVPFQLMFKHFGGEISNYTEPVQTFFNLATGLGLNFKPSEEGYSWLGVEFLRLSGKELKGVGISGITSGYASWLRLHYSYKALSLGTAYWKSHDYYAPNGNAIYSSVSDYQPDVVIHDRKIITGFIYLNLLPESYLELFLGLDSYYDLDIKRLDNAITLHLYFDKLISIATLKH